MSETQKAQLKKSDLLLVIGHEAMTRDEIVTAAAKDYEFIDSYVDYLLDHFQAQGKLVYFEETEKWTRKQTGGSSTPRTLYRVIEAEPAADDAPVEFAVESHLMTPGEYYNDEMKNDGWRQTVKAAVKVKTSEIFAQYKADTEKAKALLDTVSFEE